MASTIVVSVSLALAFIATVLGVFSFSQGIVHLVKVFKTGAPEKGRTGSWSRRLWTTLYLTLTHETFRGRPLVKVAHWLVMMSFMALILTLLNSYFQLGLPLQGLPLVSTWPPLLWIFEVFAWLGLLGIITLMIIRQVTNRFAQENRHSRFFGSTRWQAHFVEWVILIVCLCVIVLHGLDYAAQKTESPDFPWATYPLSAWVGSLFYGLPLATIANLIVVFSTVKIMVSMVWLMVVGRQTSMGISWHRFLAPVNIFTGRNLVESASGPGRKALGALAPILVDAEPTSDLDEIDDDTILGLGTTTDLTWKDRLDLYACTECGRCQSVCPAWNTDKPLSPKLLTLALRDNVSASAKSPVNSSTSFRTDSVDVLGALIASKTTVPGGASDKNSLLVEDGDNNGFLNPDVLWDCTMCGACVDQCPVDIEHIDRIANLRRFQVLMESAFPRELAKPYKNMQTKGNPYGQAAKKRLEWAKKLDFSIPVIGEDIADATSVDYLFWVGCAGAYDDRQKKTTAAVAELLYTAGISFAVLGNAESCTGDPARRSGNEVLFQLLAQTAVETLTDVKAQKIVVTCAHCFNTIANEFPELDGHFEVIHHTQLLNRLVREGNLKPVAPEAKDRQKLTYHDPCFLGRHNRVYAPPRELLEGIPGLELVEMPRNRENAMCCGAGGARAWMEETRGERIATVRMVEASQTGATTVATGCPFCTQMLDSTPNPVEGTQPPKVKDVAILLLEAVHRGQPENHQHQ